jgi:hypothetical protein
MRPTKHVGLPPVVVHSSPNLLGWAKPSAVLYNPDGAGRSTLWPAQRSDPAGLAFLRANMPERYRYVGLTLAIALERYAKELAARPAEWMPWNYCEAMAQGAV